MPLYDITCKKCGEKEVQRHLSEVYNDKGYLCVQCECGSLAPIQVTNSHNRDWFREHWRENIDLTPEYITSKNQLKEHCLRNDVTAHCLGDVRNIKEI
jgi:hypothetical protein